MKLLHKMFTVSMIVAMLFSAACTKVYGSPSTPTNTPQAITQTYTPSNTPSPSPTKTHFPNLEGRLFFDMNGSGLPDESSFIYDPVRLADPRQPLQSDLEKSIGDYVSVHPDLKNGDLITLEEPGLSGYSVCVQADCVQTDQQGNFSLPNKSGASRVSIKVTDPNAGTPALEMRYINQWNKAVVIPAYEMYGVQVPEQRLNDTTVIPLGDGIFITLSANNNVGLMQGFLTLPYRAEDADQFWISNYFDNDIRLEFIRTYNGNKSNLQNRPPYLPGANVTGIGAQHPGVDFEGPRGNFVLSVAPGKIFWVGIDQVAILILDTYEAACGHMDHTLVPQGSPIYRGQIIGVNGVYNPSNPAQPTHPHIHFGLYILGHDNTPGADPYPVLGSVDPYMDLIEKEFTSSQYINPEAVGYPSGTVGSMYFGSPGFWTTINNPNNP